MGYPKYLQGLPVTQNVSWGIIISTRSLVLQRVGRVHSGFYACAAANDRGETQSALVNLRIRCKWKSLDDVQYTKVFTAQTWYSYF